MLQMMGRQFSLRRSDRGGICDVVAVFAFSYSSAFNWCIPGLLHSFSHSIASFVRTRRTCRAFVLWRSGQLLLDEERSEMRKLPCACTTKNNKLNQRPFHNSSIHWFWLITEFCFSFLWTLVCFNLIVRLTLWNICSLLISAILPFNSLTFPTMLSILSLSSLWILLLSPIAMSSWSLTPPNALSWPENQPCKETAPGPDGMKQSLCRPLSAAENVNFDIWSEDVEVCDTTRWSLSNVSSTVTCIARSEVVWYEFVCWLNASAL